jgi:ribonuclease HI
MKLRIFTDGGARGNPGPAGVGVLIENADTGKVVERHAHYLGETTNNQAEYQAVLLGLERCKQLGAAEVDVVSDSELLVKQAKGQYRVKNPGLAERFLELRNLEAQLGRVKYRHVKREANGEADRLSNLAMDLKKDWHEKSG